MNTDDEPLPPHDEAAERSVLGAVMCSSRALADAMAVLRPEEFYQPNHQTIFRAVLAVEEAGIAVDAISVSRELEKQGTLLRVGGGPYLHTLMASVPTAANVAYYAELVANKAQLRGLVEAGKRVVAMAYSGADADDVAEVIANARKVLDDAADGARRNLGVSEVDDLAAGALAAYENPVPPTQGTGWADLDDLTGGLRPGTLTVIAARPGVGKTVIGLNLALHAAASGVGVLFASLEMPEAELIDRVLANLAKVDLHRIAGRRISPDDWRRLREARSRLRACPLRVCDQPTLGLSALRTLARDLTRTPRGLGLVVVDYLQLMRPADPRAPREQQVASFSRGLKLLGKELRVPVVALAQVNRGSETRMDKRPVVADLRESGSIEADADAVLLLHHDTSNEIKRDAEIEVIVGKNRHGRQGSVSLSWSPQYARADNLRHLQAV